MMLYLKAAALLCEPRRLVSRLVSWGDGSSKAFIQKDIVFLGKNGKHLYASDSAIVQNDEL
eukprot:6612438-Ditylum_brightwellii.AAC.1